MTRTRAFAAAIALICFVIWPIAESAELIAFDIPSGPAAEGLLQFARQARLDMVMDPEQVDRLRTPTLRGHLAIEEALRRLIAGTGINVQLDLTHKRLLVIPSLTSRKAAQAPHRLSPEPNRTANAVPTVAEAVGQMVTIRGRILYTAITEPLGPRPVVLTRQDILASGAINVDELIQMLPQVFHGAPSQIIHGTNIEARSNSGLGEGIDLRGLGASSTLVLLNGVRLAPSGNAASFTDVLNIPLTAIDHVDILLDGCSAIYGADAIAGVVNIVTLRGDTDTETILQTGGVTQGSLRQTRLGQVASEHWLSGDFVFAAELNSQSALNSSDRPFLTDSAQDAQVIPSQLSASAFGQIRQRFGQDIQATLDAMITHRRATQDNGGVQAALVIPPTRVDVLTTVSDLQIERAMGANSILSLSLSHASEQENQQIQAEVPPWYHSISTYDTLAINLNGGLGSADPIRYVVGAEVRAQRFDTARSDAVAPATRTNFRRTMAATFGELGIPLISERLAGSTAQQLDLLLAARFERYTGSIRSTTPTVSLNWKPTSQIDVMAKYSRSFRLPDPGDLNATQNTTFLANLPNQSVVLASSGNPSLRPERAISRVVGLGLSTDWSYELHSHISLHYFDDKVLDYIQSPTLAPDYLAAVLNDPTWQDEVVHNPSANLRNQICSSWLVNSGARAQCKIANTILDLPLTNIPWLQTRGVDLNTMLAWNPLWADFQWTLRGTYLLAYDMVGTPGSAPVSLLDRFGEPVDLNLRTTLRASRGNLSCAATINFVNHYHDTNFRPSVPISSWTTADLQLAYRWGETPATRRTPEWELGVSVLNAFDRPPPVAPYPIGMIDYDPANATPLGRVMTLYAIKRW